MNKMTVKELAKATELTPRTLHYYDQIGLLSPREVTEVGYRLYGNEELEKLQQILFYKDLDFSLKQIKEMMENPPYNRKEVLENHKKLLVKKRERLDRLIGLAEEVIVGITKLSYKEFNMEEISNMKKEYREEVEMRWGKTDAYKESHQKTKDYTEDDWKAINEEQKEMFLKFAHYMDKNPNLPEVQRLVKQWQEFISRRFYTCTNEILYNLGLMYSEDERFKKNIDEYGEGLSEFLTSAISIYCGK